MINSNYDDMPVRELMVKVIERWFPDDDAPYDRVDELLDPVRSADFEVGVTADMVDRWLEAASELEELKRDVPERERLVHDDPKLKASIQRGMEDAAAGRVHALGSFAPYLEDGDLEELTADEAMERLLSRARERVQVIVDPTPDQTREAMDRVMGTVGESALREYLDVINSDGEERQAWHVGMVRREDGDYDVYLLLSDPQLNLTRLDALKLSVALKVAANYSVQVEVPTLNDEGKWEVNGEVIPTRPFSELSDELRERLTVEREEVVARILELETQPPGSERTAEWRDKNLRLSEIDKVLYKRRGAGDG